MASSRLTMALPEAIARAPRDRQTVTISGSISGVSPTATDTPNSRACSQSPPAMPVTSMDTGTVTAVNAISIQDVEFMPRSKRVRGRCHWNARDSPPNSALRPVAMTTANAEPEITVVPMNARHAASVNAVSLSPAASRAAASLRTGMLSPVSAPCAMRRSRLSSSLQSAGTMSPADNVTMSPTTSSSDGICRSPAPTRRTVAVVLTMVASAVAACELRESCTYRIRPDTTTMSRMMPTVTGVPPPFAAVVPEVTIPRWASEHTNEVNASNIRTPMNGFMNALTSRRAGDSWRSGAGMVLPP